MSENKFLDFFTDHVYIVNKQLHISGSLINFVYIKKALMEENIYFPNYDTVKILTEKIFC